MGGATSKLKETDWDLTDGKLTDSSETIDGAPPTSRYGIYHLTKRGVNQREFDITDSESNLLYTTRQVPGTIACFDVLGKELDSHLLRVTVDIARRYWTVYRFEVATFEGQKPDKEATEKLVAERLHEAEADPMVENFNTPFLFRKAIIVVSWSRYMAVSTLYGPPTEQMVKQWEDQQLAQKKEEEEKAEANAPKKLGLIYQPPLKEENESVYSGELDTKTKEFKCAVVQDERPLKKTLSSDSSLGEESFGGSEPNIAVELQEVDFNDENVQSSAEAKSITSTELETTSDGPIDPNSRRKFSLEIFPSSSSASASTAGGGKQNNESSSQKRTNFRTWAKQKSKHFREKSRSALEKSGIISKIARRDPTEGVIHLNKPMLLCQEIYTRIIGNHQTSRISKEKALELLRQDVAQHEKEAPEAAKNENHEEDPIMPGQEVILRSRSEDSGDGEPESKTVELEDQANGESSREERENADSAEKKEEAVDEKEQELVGYWLWENTLRTHKMKMHVAKGADLALHVVLAIIVNQVRYERNAIAITI
ncbi:hypothetical protein ACA910_014089 [Epithemia clementina (nom. ined.)]